MKKGLCIAQTLFKIQGKGIQPAQLPTSGSVDQAADADGVIICSGNSAASE
jgi:hypothetical protein